MCVRDNRHKLTGAWHREDQRAAVALWETVITTEVKSVV